MKVPYLNRIQSVYIPLCCAVLSHAWLFVTPWTVAHQTLCLWGFSSKNIGVGCHAFLQGIFPNQESNQGLLPCRQILHHLRQLAKSSRRDNNKDSELNACVCSVMSNSATPWTAAQQVPPSKWMPSKFIRWNPHLHCDGVRRWEVIRSCRWCTHEWG